MRKRALAAAFFILAMLPLAVGYPVVTDFILPHWRSNSAGYVIGVFGIASPETIRNYGVGALIVLALMGVGLVWFGLRVWFERD